MSHKWFLISHEISLTKIFQMFNMIERRDFYALVALFPTKPEIQQA